jgi:hypothetical protein
MDNKSNVDSYWHRFKSKKPFSLIGLYLIIFSVCVVTPFLLILSATIKEPFEKYDYQQIISHGIVQSAKIKNIQIKQNVTFNNINPRIVTYEYMYNNINYEDKFQTIDIQMLNDLNKSDSIKIIIFKDQSIIKDLTPYSFPFRILWPIPLMFLVVGFPLFLIGHFAAIKKGSQNTVG